ncbi:hypothetical protein SAMN05445756_0138 [Kytococcus aerolatus]|uniref:CueP family metal-binding protein n=1 Tax=Kytococcus aerolatus TaxID=592308 RepID=A0A212T1S4_9MICO|nr:CueP family metal-binding protein [Kytococcus aerolatus]SNC59781.1 hypothetical protein SAMN05445756_0138 [Kytococcus aerolatus]
MPCLRLSRRRNALAAVFVAILALVLAGCAVTPSGPAPSSVSSQTSEREFLADHGLSGLDVRQVIERLDTMPVADRPTDLLASVQPEALVLTDDQERETRLPLPEDEVYISIAPYRDQTHDCYFHSLTTCLGELASEEVQVTLTGADGEVIIDEARQTYDNGFIGLWVPRDTEVTLTIEHEGQEANARISTMNDDDATCITTMRLQ